MRGISAGVAGQEESFRGGKGSDNSEGDGRVGGIICTGVDWDLIILQRMAG